MVEYLRQYLYAHQCISDAAESITHSMHGVPYLYTLVASATEALLFRLLLLTQPAQSIFN